ncbi:ParA family protein [Alistipes finegoldii]|uniref:ParA family protein n=1 Tax=Alistipes finegoldii TaxID=214856 RepID=UPI001FC8CF99|nr:AAA family ATPase [Alistipes finegoldii]
MNKKPISISFANQKGGIGKSTLTVLAASWLRYVRGLNVLVVDCDFPQNSIVELREREKKAVMKNDAYKLMLQRQFERLQKKAYPVIRSTPENADNDVQVFLASEPEPYDVVLYDLPGTMGTKGVIYTISLLNYLFIPMRADRLVMQSTLNFAQTVYNVLRAIPVTSNSVGRVCSGLSSSMAFARSRSRGRCVPRLRPSIFLSKQPRREDVGFRLASHFLPVVVVPVY